MNIAEIDEKINPFLWHEDPEENCYSVSLGVDYKYDIVENGSNWNMLAMNYLKEYMPEYLGKIEFDSERDCFQAIGCDREIMETFAIMFSRECTNKEGLNDLISMSELHTNSEMIMYMNELGKMENNGEITHEQFRNMWAERFLKRFEWYEEILNNMA